MDHDQGRPVHLGDNLRHREGLSRSRHAQEHLALVAALEPFSELGNGAPLIAQQLEVGNEVELIEVGGHRSRGTAHFLGLSRTENRTTVSCDHEGSTLRDLRVLVIYLEAAK